MFLIWGFTQGIIMYIGLFLIRFIVNGFKK